MNVQLEPDVAIVVHDIVQALTGPLSEAEAAFALREARFVLPSIRAALEAAGIDADNAVLPDIPLLRPGSAFH